MTNSPPVGKNNPEVYFNLAQSLLRQGDALHAVEAFGQAIALQPNFWPAYLERARLRIQGQDFYPAIRDLETVIKLTPDNSVAFLDLGRAWHAIGRQDLARDCFKQAITIDPKSAEAYYNLGVIDYHDGNIDASVEHYERAIERKPDFVIAYSNLGVALQAREQTEKALAILDQGIALAPNDPSAYWNKALLLLRNAHYLDGWRLYEWRWVAGKAGVYRRFPGRPLWLGGTSLAGKTILLHAEQGFGDTIQFVRYVQLVAAAGARIILEVSDPLVSLCRRLDNVSEVITAGRPLPRFDCHCPLMSLPLAFGTVLDSIPATVPYIRPEPARVAAWASRLGPRQRPRVGLVWQGNPQHDGDIARSAPLETLRDALVDGVEYVCLQKSVSVRDMALAQATGMVRMIGPDFEHFDDTCAAIELCDVVISVDTSVAHLAGAMAKPTWIMLPRRAEWRWLQDRRDTPWYPTARLFRQHQQGDWTQVMATVKEQLRAIS